MGEYIVSPLPLCLLQPLSPSFPCRLKPLDIEFMKQLHHLVNIIPVIAKADTLTPREIKALKIKVRVALLSRTQLRVNASLLLEPEFLMIFIDCVYHYIAMSHSNLSVHSFPLPFLPPSHLSPSLSISHHLPLTSLCIQIMNEIQENGIKIYTGETDEDDEDNPEIKELKVIE